MSEKLEQKAEEVGEEASHSPCEGIGFCYRSSHFVVNKVKWNNCHTANHSNCDYRSLLIELGSL